MNDDDNDDDRNLYVKCIILNLNNFFYNANNIYNKRFMMVVDTLSSFFTSLHLNLDNIMHLLICFNIVKN